MRKVVFVIAMFASLALLLFIIADIVNSLVSYQYEIEGPPKVDYIDMELASGYLMGKIIWLKIFSCYVVVSIILFGYFISNKEK